MRTTRMMVIMLIVWALPAQAERNAERPTRRKQNASPLVMAVQLSEVDQTRLSTTRNAARPALRKLGPAPKVHLTTEQIAEVAGGIQESASGEVLIVDCHGNFDHNTIQGAIDAASDGDIIVVLPNTCTEEGHYFENINFLGKAITVQSLLPENSEIVEATVVNGSGEDLSTVSLFLGESVQPILAGMTITGGSGTPNVTDPLNGELLFEGTHVGGGVLVVGGSPRIERCRLVSNHANHGGGIGVHGGAEAHVSGCRITDNLVENEATESYIWFGVGGGLDGSASSLLIESSTIARNIAFHGFDDPSDSQFPQRAVAGAGISFLSSQPDTSLVVKSCVIQTNRVAGSLVMPPIGGGILAWTFGHSAPVLIKNTLIADNAAAVGGGLAISGVQLTSSIEGCTITGNSHTIVSPLSPTGPMTISNSIFYHNQSPTESLIPIGSSTISYSNVETADGSVVEGPGNINVDPLFVDALAGNYHLSAASPCIDAGDPDFDPGEGESDVDGDARTLNDRIDMGADEYDSDCNDNETPDSQDIAKGTSNDCNSNGIPDECRLLELDCNGNGTPDDCDILAGAPDVNVNGRPDECDPQHSLFVSVDDPACDDTGPGTPDAPFCNIQPAVNATSFLAGRTDFTEIIVDDGLYSGPENSFINFVGRLATLRSAQGPDNCIISGFIGLVFYNGETPLARVEGFTVRDAAALPSPDWSTIRCINSSPTFDRCVITESTGDLGGGIFFKFSHSILQSCLISKNVAAEGGGVYAFFSDLTIRNTTVADNSAASSGGGVVIAAGTAVIDNSVLWGNGAPQGAQASALENGTTLSVSYSDIQGGTDGVFVADEAKLIWGAGNLDVDPMFYDPDDNDYHLLPGSVCRDAGDPDFIPEEGQTDIDGDARVVAERVDMGADEFLVPCAADLDGDGIVGPFDLASLLGWWGPCDPSDPCHQLDANSDGIIGPFDLAALLGAWGPCP